MIWCTTAREIRESRQGQDFRSLTFLICKTASCSLPLDYSHPNPPPLPFLRHGRSRPRLRRLLTGFRRDAFNEDQLQNVQPFVGELTETSLFMETWYMYFPFFSSEVKCGAAALDVADRQNAHSMTLAVRGVVELFRLVKREKELHRQILAFSISHDHRSVRIYGHYPVTEGKDHVLPSSNPYL